jgi:hypothetical protein
MAIIRITVDIQVPDEMLDTSIIPKVTKATVQSIARVMPVIDVAAEVTIHPDSDRKVDSILPELPAGR